MSFSVVIGHYTTHKPNLHASWTCDFVILQPSCLRANRGRQKLHGAQFDSKTPGNFHRADRRCNMVLRLLSTALWFVQRRGYSFTRRPYIIDRITIPYESFDHFWQSHARKQSRHNWFFIRGKRIKNHQNANVIYIVRNMLHQGKEPSNDQLDLSLYVHL